MKIVIIGNGPSCLDKRNGKDIDRYDTVIRINDYAIDGFESFVGTKTDIWAMDTKVFSWNQKYLDRFKTIKNIWVLPSLAFSSSRKEIRDRLCELSANLFVSELEDVKKINEEIQGFPSTGLMAIQTAIRKFPGSIPIDIMGFDHFDNNRTEYWNNETKKKIPHLIGKERQYVEKRIKEGKLFRI